MLDFDKYKDDMEVYQKPRRPILERGHTVSEVRQYASALEKYEKKEFEWKEHIKQVHIRQAELENQFREDLIEDLGIKDNPKAGLLFSKAWELGHSSGYHEVYNYACDLVDLIL